MCFPCVQGKFYTHTQVHPGNILAKHTQKHKIYSSLFPFFLFEERLYCHILCQNDVNWIIHFEIDKRTKQKGTLPNTSIVLNRYPFIHVPP